MKRLLVALMVVLGLVKGLFAEETVVRLDSLSDPGGEVIQDGWVLTGNNIGTCKLSIADGATVILSNATILATGGAWAGLTCISDATIILAGDNWVAAYNDGQPGIYVPEGNTLVIKGTGSLNVRGWNYAAGIGSGYEDDGVLYGWKCGNITIEGGTIMAYGGKYAAGIGSGDLCSCGNIKIFGGNVTAEGGSLSAGIGTGRNGSCGTITIEGGTVAATGGNISPGVDCGGAGIGAGQIGECDEIYISGCCSVTATGGPQAAGIGTAYDGEITDGITVQEGAIVTATGGSEAAGVGTGKEGSMGGDFVFKASYVTATCGTGCNMPIGKWKDSRGEWEEGGWFLDNMNDDEGYPTRKVWWNGNLATTSLKDGIRVLDGMTLYGTYPNQNQYGKKHKIIIAANATVTLDNATIDGKSASNGDSYKWAGLSCEGGESTIILKGENAIRSFHADYPGIYVPEGATLNITGDGTLWAEGGSHGAGIGGGKGLDCGTVKIEDCKKIWAIGSEAAGIGGGREADVEAIYVSGGDVVASGGNKAAGIGGAYMGNVGLVSLQGGIVKADGGLFGAGVGSGLQGTVHTISIGNGAIVTANGGSESNQYGDHGGGAGIGSGRGGTVGSITIQSCDITATRGGSVSMSQPAVPIGAGALGTFSQGSIAFPDNKYGLVDDNGIVSRNIYWDGDLSKLTWSGLARNNTIIHGTLSGDHKVLVNYNATVTLEGANIYGSSDASDPHPGIACLGDATFIVKGSNYVRPYGKGPASIWSPGNVTYDYQGGSLNVGEPSSKKTMSALRRGADPDPDYGGAGIGAGYNMPCSNITIRGTGTLIAGGGYGAAGIGGAHGGACGNISIEGVNITTTGGTGAAGLGSGDDDSECGDIIISGGSVSATAGTGANAIGSGSGSNSTCGNVVARGMVINTSGSTSTVQWDGYLPTLESDAVAYDQVVISGVLRCPVKITIADGATVILSNATIMVSDANSSDYPWAGLNCAGSATIILKGSNRIRGFYGDYPGIYVRPDYTLTFAGDGTLRTESRGSAAGIGGGSDLDCGAVVISNGTIDARGGYGSAGIGSGARANCDYVHIYGGKVLGIGGDYGAGIGTGWEGVVRYVTMEGGDVTARGGYGAAGVGGGSAGIVDKALNSVEPSILINNGSLKAMGGPYAPGIGAGCNGSDCEQIKITGGTTIATRGYECTDTIGAGANEPDWTGTASRCREGLVIAAQNPGYTLVDDEGYPKRTIKTVCDLGGLSGEDNEVLLYDGTYVTGTLGSAKKLVIVNGATVTLTNAIIPGATSGDNAWAGLTCLGNAKIILENANTVRGYRRQGIAVPEGSTLTIDGDGSLTVKGNGDSGTGSSSMVYGAGIGACGGTPCGNITILGGTINATGSSYSAGIGGSRNSSCGNISIQGGSITTTGGRNAPGIGTGSSDSSCGTIDIGAGIVGVEAKCNSYSSAEYCTNAIGVAIGTLGDVSNNSCGTVTVESGLQDSTEAASPYTRTIVFVVPVVWDGDLGTLNSDVTITNGMTIFGTLQDYYKVTIAAGATVTISNVFISLPIPADTQAKQWAGINCEGDARIVLVDDNTVKGFHIYFPGIHVPEGYTLTIAGSGTLNASSNGRGAGIGGGWNISCGNIVIEGGTINARGGTYCAGIGGGYSNLVSVSCGNITISNGITKVVATGGYSATAPIGAGLNCTCGTVTVHPDLIDDRGSPTRTIVAGMGYKAFATRSGYGAWNAVNTRRGTYNVFLYAFGITPYMPDTDFTLIDITFDAAGKAVVKTPPLKNKAGFTFTIEASDNVDGTGEASSYELHPSGETVIDETGKTKRFFRLKAVERAVEQ